MRIAILSAGDGWHVRDLKRAAAELGHEAVAVDFRRVCARVPSLSAPRSSLPESAPSLSAPRSSLPESAPSLSAPSLSAPRSSLPESTPSLSAPRSSLPESAPSLSAPRSSLPESDHSRLTTHHSLLTTLGGFDAVLVRTMPPGSLEQVIFRMDVLHRLQAEGVRVLNPPRTVEVCVDKYLATAKLAEAGLCVPETIVCQTADAALEAFAALGGDVVVKPIFGSEGRGMVRVADADLAWRTFRAIERTQGVLYLQRFVAHPGWDLRVFVLAGKVLAAMRRWAGSGWRTNVAQGGRAEAVQPSVDEERLALAAADAVAAPLAGIDLIQDEAGRWYVLEVNAVPGWRALAPVTGVDVAAAIVRLLVEN